MKPTRAVGTETSLVRENRRLQGKVKPGKNLRCEGKRGVRTSQELSSREREFDDLEKERKNFDFVRCLLMPLFHSLLGHLSSSSLLVVYYRFFIQSLC